MTSSSPMRAWLALLLCLGFATRAGADDDYLLDHAQVVPLAAHELLAEPPNFAFPVGERLEYAIQYLGISVGTIVLEVARFIEVGEHRVAHVVATGVTNDFFSAIYPIRDRSEAWIDLDSLQTLRTALHTRHGRSKETRETVVFDWDAHWIDMVEDKHHRRRRREVGMDFGPFVHDTFDIFYAIRALPLTPGSRLDLPVYADRKIYELRVEANRIAQLEVAGQQREAIVVRPQSRLDGEARGDGQGELWLSADGYRVPLRLRGWFQTSDGFKVGGVAADLVRHVPGRRVVPPARIVPPAPALVTEEGQPIWEPPPAVARVRIEKGKKPYDRKRPLGGVAAIASAAAAR